MGEKRHIDRRISNMYRYSLLQMELISPIPTPVGWAKFSDLFPRIEFGKGKTNFTAAQSGK